MNGQDAIEFWERRARAKLKGLIAEERRARGQVVLDVLLPTENERAALAIRDAATLRQLKASVDTATRGRAAVYGEWRRRRWQEIATELRRIAEEKPMADWSTVAEIEPMTVKQG